MQIPPKVAKAKLVTNDHLIPNFFMKKPPKMLATYSELDAIVILTKMFPGIYF